MQKRPSKKQLRQQLEQDMTEFLQHGGNVQDMPRGASGLVDGRYGQVMTFDKAPQSRTPVNDVMQAIDQRKDQKRQKAPSSSAKGRKKTVIYDDFGEAVRIIWE